MKKSPSNSLGLGLLVGLQREKAASELAGIRTFALISLMGTMSGFLGQKFGGWIIGAGFVTLAVIILSAKLFVKRENYDASITTEIAAILI